MEFVVMLKGSERVGKLRVSLKVNPHFVLEALGARCEREEVGAFLRSIHFLVLSGPSLASKWMVSICPLALKLFE